jgi:hypothetical protein
MTNCYSLHLYNASLQDWTFFVYQTPATPDARIASRVWISSSCTVAIGAHATLMWSDELNFIWCTGSEHASGMPFNAGGRRRVDRVARHGVLFNLDRNAPGFEECSSELAPGPMTVTVAANVPNKIYAIGTSMDGVATLTTSALMTQSYDFTPRYWIAAGRGVLPASVVDPGMRSPRLEVRFPAGVSTLSFYLNQQDEWHPCTTASPQAGFAGGAQAAPPPP